MNTPTKAKRRRFDRGKHNLLDYGIFHTKRSTQSASGGVEIDRENIRLTFLDVRRFLPDYPDLEGWEDLRTREDGKVMDLLDERFKRYIRANGLYQSCGYFIKTTREEPEVIHCYSDAVLRVILGEWPPTVPELLGKMNCNHLARS